MSETEQNTTERKSAGKQSGSKTTTQVSSRDADADVFTEKYLGLKLYDWQKKVLLDLSQPGARVALKAANGSGKTAMIAAPAALWYGLIYPGSIVITTSGVYRQVKEQMWPQIRSLASKVAGLGMQINQTDLTMDNGSRILGFATDSPNRFEGFHGNVFIILDECKSIDETLFEAVARIQPSRILAMSSPGGTTGKFYKIFSKEQKWWQLHTVTAFDCPHIKQSWVDEQMEMWGKDHPLIRSMIFGEFQETSGEGLVVPWDTLMQCLDSPPNKEGHEVVAACDFAAAGDESVFCMRVGNKITKLVAWREANTMAGCARFALEFEKAGLKPEQIFGDAGGLGLPMCHQLAEMGWPIHQVNLGGRAHDPDRYTNRGTEMWFEAARQIDRCESILPDCEILHSQLTTRRVATSKTGKLNLESKKEMKSRGFSSPDRADALVMAMASFSDQYMWERRWQPDLEEVLEAGMAEWSGDHKLRESMGLHTG
jgi:phage terminase large subunit